MKTNAGYPLFLMSLMALAGAAAYIITPHNFCRTMILLVLFVLVYELVNFIWEALNDGN